MQQHSPSVLQCRLRNNTFHILYCYVSELTCSELMYVFTVRPHTTEDFKAAELQYFASKQLTAMDSNSVLSIQIHFIEDTPPRCRLMGIHRQPSPGRRWRTLDITSHLVHIINASKSITSKIVIGVSFKVHAGSHDTPHDREVIERVISNHARPFLLMFAFEDESNEKNSVFPWAKEEATKLHHEKTGLSRHTRSIETKTYPIITNEFPEGGSTNLAHQATFQHFTEQDSKRRKEKKHTSKKRKGNSKKHGKAPLLDPTSSLSDVDTDPVLDDDDMNTVDPGNGVCSRHQMFVNFNTINWDRYVIAPAGFDAYYCAGPCSFPLSKVNTSLFSSSVLTLSVSRASMYNLFYAPKKYINNSTLQMYPTLVFLVQTFLRTSVGIISSVAFLRPLPSDMVFWSEVSDTKSQPLLLLGGSCLI